MSSEVSTAPSGLLRWRWVLAAFLLLTSALNYVDRQALSILAPVIQHDLHLSDLQYGYVVQVFLFCYAAMYFLSGRIVDRISVRFAEAAFLFWWSLAAMLTAFITGFRSLMVMRSLLGIGEPGNYTASAKVVSEWFPPHERGTAVGLYSMGGTLGAAVAAPLIAYLAIAFGWRSAFMATGLVGMILGIVWLALYRRPSCKASSIKSMDLTAESVTTPVRLDTAALLRSKPFWTIVWTRMATDPVWYFYLFWFPKYLQDVRGMSLAAVGKLVWLIFVAADAGSLVGGLAVAKRIKNGVSPINARVRLMVFAAVIPCFSFTIPLLHGYLLPVAAACCAAFAHMAWMTNATTLPLDMFPADQIGAIQGAIGALSSVAAFVSTGLIAYCVSHFSYNPVFLAASFLYPVALVVLVRLPRIFNKGVPVTA